VSDSTRRAPRRARWLAPSVLTALALVAGAATLPAQSIADIGARVAPQFYSYKLNAPSSTTVSEWAVPLYVLVPVSPSLSFDVGTAYASSRVQQSVSGQSVTSSVSGLTDTQVRANYTLGTDFVVLTAGVNLPTGQSTVTSQQALAAGLIGSDFLAFPISTMGSGFGGTGGIAVARPIGDWDLGIGASARRSAEYAPFDVAGGAELHYQPGNEYRVRAGIDRAVGTGRISFGLTYSTFGDDNLAGSIYNTGDRYIGTFGFSNTVGGNDLTVTGWNLYRTSGQLSDSSTVGRQNITDVAAAYGVRVGSQLIEPNVEGRTWLQAGLPTSYLGTIGIRTQFTVAGFAVLPSVGYTIGQVAADEPTGVATTASMTGFHAILAVRLR
jgi:hypothetical protein